MSKLNINKNEWLELVFEGKNKEYGAYQLRQENGKTTMKAFFSAIALISGIALLPVVLSSFTKKPVIVAIPTMYSNNSCKFTTKKRRTKKGGNNRKKRRTKNP
ncbi:hypothetical protein AAIP42_000580 [Flavobacterium psychrophilum]|nr:hypothetical protein [Flavobacterium psychrophilum]